MIYNVFCKTCNECKTFINLTCNSIFGMLCTISCYQSQLEFYMVNYKRVLQRAMLVLLFVSIPLMAFAEYEIYKSIVYDKGKHTLRMINKRNLNRIRVPLNDYVSPLALACKHRLHAVAYTLIYRGADINGKTVDGNNCAVNLASAIYNHKLTQQDKDIFLLLIKKGVDINDRGTWGRTALHFAAMYGNTALVDFLLKKGANKKLKDSNALTAADLAIRKKHYVIAKKLIGKFKSNKEAFEKAIKNSQYPVVKQMVMNVTDAAKRKEYVNQVLIEDIGSRPLHVALVRAKDSDDGIKIAKLLIQNGADINAQDSLGISPLMTAIGFGSPKLAAHLIGLGADLNIVQKYGCMKKFTAAHYAVNYRQLDVLKLLVKKGINLKNKESFNPLWVARDWEPAFVYLIDNNLVPMEWELYGLIRKNLKKYKKMLPLDPMKNYKAYVEWVTLVGIEIYIKKKFPEKTKAYDAGNIEVKTGLKATEYYDPDAKRLPGEPGRK